MLYYLDNFFVILLLSNDAVAYSQQFNNLCNNLGLSVNHFKDAMGTRADFLGIKFNSMTMQGRLPPDKLARARNTIENIINRATILYYELETAVGFLLFVAKLVIPGRAFLRRLFNALQRPAKFIYITTSIKVDLRWWKDFLRE